MDIFQGIVTFFRYYEARGEETSMEQLLKEVDENLGDEMIKAFIRLEIKSKFADFGKKKS